MESKEKTVQMLMESMKRHCSQVPESWPEDQVIKTEPETWHEVEITKAWIKGWLLGYACGDNGSRSHYLDIHERLTKLRPCKKCKGMGCMPEPHTADYPLTPTHPCFSITAECKPCQDCGGTGIALENQNG